MKMRWALLYIPVIVLFACNRTTKTNPVKEGPTHKIVSEKKFINTSNIIEVSTFFPKDTIYPAKILVAGGVFHEDEIDPRSAEYNWKGLFKTDSNYYIGDTKIKLSKDYDAVLDEGGKKTGWVIKPNIKDTCVLLISCVDSLKNGRVLSVKPPQESLMPGESERFLYNGVEYKLYATGQKKAEHNSSNSYIISNYKLYLKATINDREYNELLVSVSNFDDTITSILFIGDIDGDMIPDLIIDTASDYNAETPTLYLFKPANNGHLLKVMGMHTSVGC
jgi:hypothetical protein